MVILKNTNVSILLLSILLVLSAFSFVLPAKTTAAPIPAGCPGSTLQGPKAPSTVCPASNDEEIVDCKANPGDTKNCIAQPHGTACTGQESSACGLFTYINDAIEILSALIGIVVTGMIIVGGIRYSAAGSDPGAVEKAKKMIFNAILILVGYGLIFAIAQWVLPGGILS